MRPRELPAEDPDTAGRVRERDAASMRPRELPAEDLLDNGVRPRASGFNEAAGVTRGRRTDQPTVERRQQGFNEAAGVTRGRLDHRRQRARYLPAASMRPRELPAEDAWLPSSTRPLHAPGLQ